MLSILLSVTIIFLAAWTVAVILRNASASQRHMVWTCAFLAALVLAPLRWRMPRQIISAPLPAVSVTAITVSAAPPHTTTPSSAKPDAAQWLLTFWTLGAVAFGARLLFQAIRLRALLKSAQGKPPVLQSAAIQSPLAAGLFRPVILLPESCATWTTARRRAVLAHESAHIRRHDPAILLAAHAVTCIYWFHPLCWLALSRLRAESERACDDAALRTGLLPSGYAGHLLDLAGKLDFQLAIPMASTSHLESRVKHILDPKTNRSASAGRPWAIALLISGALLIPLTSVTIRAQQSGSSSIGGIVTDPTGARVPRARVIATNADVTFEETTIAREDGSYSFTSMPAGHYSIEVLAPGFARFHLSDLALVSGGSLQKDARLALGNLNEVISVAGQGKPKPKAPAPAVAPQRIRVGGNVQAAALLKQVRPVYPPELQDQGVEGSVLLRAIISKEGVPQALTVVKPAVDPALASAAIEAVQQWRYRPTMLNGEPVEVTTTIQVNFTLN